MVGELLGSDRVVVGKQLRNSGRVVKEWSESCPGAVGDRSRTGWRPVKERSIFSDIINGQPLRRAQFLSFCDSVFHSGILNVLETH